MRPLLGACAAAIVAALPAGAARTDDGAPGAGAAGGAPPAADPAAAAILTAAHARHADLLTKGLTSFKAKVTLRRADDPATERIRDSAGFVYSFTAPDREEFDFGDTLEAARKPLRDSVTGLWREVTGALWFRELEASTDLRLDGAKSGTALAGTGPKTGAFEASFTGAAGPLLAVTFAADKATRAWTCDESPAGFRVRRREISLGGNVVFTTTYDVHRTVAKMSLPTVVAFEVNGKRTEFHLEYVRLDDKPAWADDLDPAVVKAAVDAFEKAWKALDDAGKAKAVRDLAEFESDLASAEIAKVALHDPSAAVREAAAEALGVMKRGNVVPALLSALPANEKEIRVYLRLIQALGEIGDPRAVDALSKDWWNQRIPENAALAADAKIRALGRIRDARSVDALLDTFTVASEDKIAPFRGQIVASLKALTGQDFGFDRRAWSEWWKKSRASFRF